MLVHGVSKIRSSPGASIHQRADARLIRLNELGIRRCLTALEPSYASMTRRGRSELYGTEHRLYNNKLFPRAASGRFTEGPLRGAGNEIRLD